MNKKIILSLTFLCLVFFSYAQDALTLQASGANLDVLYRNEMNASLVVHSRGFGVNVRRGQHVTGTKTRFLEFELVSMKHSKQTKVSNPLYPSSKGFYYGKLNSVLVLRSGVGYHKTIFGKADRERKSVEIRYNVFVGPSIGLAKPVYLEIIKSNANSYEFNISSEKYDPQKHQITDIYGKAPYSRGFGEMKFYPGAYAKFGLSAEYADMHNDVKAIETGIIIDAYPKAVPIMAYQPNNPFFVTLYLNFTYGKKWF